MGSMCASPRYVIIPPPLTHPTHPTYPNQIRMVVCAQVQGMLPSHPHPPQPIQPIQIKSVQSYVGKSMVPSHPHPLPTHPTYSTCIGRMYASPRYVTHTQPIQRPIQIKSVQSYVCKSKVRYHPHPPTHPTHPTYPNQIGMVICMQVQGMLSSPPTHPTHPSNLYWEDVCKSKVCYHPPPPHPPTHPTHPSNLYWEDVCKSKVCYHPPPPHPPTPLNEAQVREKPRRGASDTCEAQVRARHKWEKMRGASESPAGENVSFREDMSKSWWFKVTSWSPIVGGHLTI